ncbi:MAG: hypothetical protein ACLRTI_11340, partial [Blautia sp.]
MNGFHVKYPDNDDHLNGYDVVMGRDTTAELGGKISGHAYMEDGSGHRSVDEASFTGVPVSSAILSRLVFCIIDIYNNLLLPTII